MEPKPIRAHGSWRTLSVCVSRSYDLSHTPLSFFPVDRQRIAGKGIVTHSLSSGLRRQVHSLIGTPSSFNCDMFITSKQYLGEAHQIIEDGYNKGRDWLVEKAIEGGRWRVCLLFLLSFFPSILFLDTSFVPTLWFIIPFCKPHMALAYSMSSPLFVPFGPLFSDSYIVALFLLG